MNEILFKHGNLDPNSQSLFFLPGTLWWSNNGWPEGSSTSCMAMFERCLVEMDGGTWVATISHLMSQINVIETCVVIIIESKLFKYKVTFKQSAISFETLVISSKLSPFFCAQKLWCFTRHRHDFFGKVNPHDCSICWTSMLTSSPVLRETEDLDKLRLMRRSKKNPDPKKGSLWTFFGEIFGTQGSWEGQPYSTSSIELK